MRYTNKKENKKMCKTTQKAIDFYDTRMEHAGDIAEALKEVAADEEGNQIGELIKKIEKSRKVTEKMKIELADLILSKTTDYIWKDSLAYYENGGE